MFPLVELALAAERWWALIVGRVAAAGTFVDLYGLILSGRRVVGAGDLDRADGVFAVQAAAIGARAAALGELLPPMVTPGRNTWADSLPPMAPFWLTLAASHGHIRQWLTAILCAAEDPDRVKGWGRRAIAVRLVLLALGQAAMVSGSSTIEFGTRNLALHSALSHRTVSRVLRLLRDEPDPLIDLVSPRRLARADRYALRIPDRYADSVRWRRRRAGRIEAAHPAFLILGGTSALVYQVLDQAEARGAEVARAARLSVSATSAALRVLAEHGLAERGPRGWRRGDASLDEVATSTGAADLQREREERYRRDRESWRARLAQYQGARHRPVSERDGWWSLEDPDEYDFMACRWPVLSDDFVRGPPSAEVRESA